MKIDRRSLTYLGTLFVAFMLYKAISAEQWAIAGVVLLAYLAFAFGVDKFIIDFRSKKVEFNDSDPKN